MIECLKPYKTMAVLIYILYSSIFYHLLILYLFASRHHLVHIQSFHCLRDSMWFLCILICRSGNDSPILSKLMEIWLACWRWLLLNLNFHEDEYSCPLLCIILFHFLWSREFLYLYFMYLLLLLLLSSLPSFFFCYY